MIISVLSGVEDEDGDVTLKEQEALKLKIQMAENLDNQDAYVKTKTQISFVVTTKLISAFVFATQIA